MDIAVPTIKNNFFCIVDRHSPELAAIVSSYLSEVNCFLPLFELQGVTAPRSAKIAYPSDEHTFSQQRAETVSMTIRNAIVRLNGCDNIVLVGLSEDQKSYLQLPDGFNVFTIDSQEEAHGILSTYFETPKPALYCHPGEILKGLHLALKDGNWLYIDDYAEPLTYEYETSSGCVVIENDNSAMAVMAVNYAVSVNAEVIVVARLADKEEKDILYHLADWKLNGDRSCFERIEEKITSRIGPYDFSGYDYVTFFTSGIPYSLLLGSITCCTYVHLNYSPDHFTFNNILYAGISGSGTGLLISPQAFVLEEIDDVTALLDNMKFHVGHLVGPSATVFNVSRYLQHYPYDLLHICSHGGEIPGRRIQSEFIDGNGTEQSVVYDHVTSFGKTPFQRNGEPLIEVHHMVFPRAYNGLDVGSNELEAKQYPSAFFVECQNAVIHNATIRDTLISEVRQVTDSRSVMCSDYPFMGMISYLAGGMKPVIFNNTCWSWGPVAESFLENGAKGYIGTLWNINNKAAVDSAIAFYKNLSTMPVAEAIRQAARDNQPDEAKNIYIFYGFHFTRLLAGASPAQGRQHVQIQLKRRMEMFRRNRLAATEKKVQEDLDFILHWHQHIISRI